MNKIKTTQHTPGPWRYEYEIGYCGEIIAANGATVCRFGDEPIANDARLISAAPELLASLEEVMAYCVEHGHDWMCMAQARAAIAKATGTT